MINRKKAFVAIGMSVVLSSYLMAVATGECDVVDGKYQVKNNSGEHIDYSLKACINKAEYFSGIVSFNQNMTINLSEAIYIDRSNPLTIDGEGQEIIISGGDATNIFTDYNSNKVTLKDLTFRNGRLTDGSNNGAALRINNQGTVDIINVTFYDNNNSSTGFGGAIYIDNEDTDTNVVVNITDSTFLRNGATKGGAIYVGGGVELNVDGTEFRENYDIGFSGSGAGIYTNYTGQLSVRDSSFTANSSVNIHGYNGVAIFIGNFTTLDMYNTTFSSHNIVFQGSSTTAMIKMSSSGTLTINESEFYDNNMTIIDALLYESNATISDSTIRDNVNEEGRLIELTADNIDVESSKFMNNNCEFGLIELTADKVTINNSEFVGNRAMECACIVSDVDDVTISNSTLSGNSAIGGSAICAFDSSDFKIVNSTISGNTVIYHYEETSTYSGTILVYDSNLTIENSTIVRNNGENGTVAGIFDSNSSIELNNTILINNIVDFLQSNVNQSLDVINYSIVGSDVSASTELNVQQGVDPKLGLLADNGGDTKTHALMPDSPAIDAGYTAILLDQRGEARKGDPDIGSYEYQGGGMNPAIIMYLLN